MWREYFQNAIIYGIDEKDCPAAKDRDRIKFLAENAYTSEVINNLPGDFDIIIDDGPHTLDTMTFTIKEYLKKINNNGILVIEDLQDFHWSNILRKHVPDNYSIEVRDLRKVRNRYDDIAMVIRPIKA